MNVYACSRNDTPHKKTFLTRSYRPDNRTDPGIVEWFGPRENKKTGATNYTQDDALQALARIEKYLISHGAVMRRTPAGAGMILLEHMLPKMTRWYPLPDGPQSLIRHEMTNACVQFVPHADKIQQIVCYDARTAYISKAQNVPCFYGDADELISDTKDEFAGYRLGFYEVEVTVPRGWRHIGLAPRRPRQYAQYWDYPNTPGDTWTTWLDGAELLLLRKNNTAPWPHAIRKRILFPEGSGGRFDPLGPMMKDISSYIERIGDHPSGPDQAVVKLIRAGLRAMAINTIGYLHNKGKEATANVPFGEIVPASIPARSWPDVQPDGSTTYHWLEPHSGMLGRWDQPQISQHIWSKWRAAILAKALTVPYGQILGIYTDAIYLSAPAPSVKEWQDNGKVGSFRTKDAPVTFARPMPAPTKIDRLLEMFNNG